MKKLGVVLLSVCLLCAMCAPAVAENGYELLKLYFSLEDYGSLGTPGILPNSEDSDHILSVLYNGDAGVFMLSGVNENGEDEISYWTGVDFPHGLSAMLLICNAWSVLEAYLDDGYSMHVLLYMNKDHEILITDAEDAALFCGEIEKAVSDVDQVK